MADDRGFTIHLEQLQDFEFKVRFDWENVDDLVLDEPEPIGNRAGPNAARLVAAAVGNCLSASLLFCLQRARVELEEGITAAVTGRVERNEKGRLRLAGIKAQISLPVTGRDGPVGRCLGLFEDFCLVTAAIRTGIPVEVEVVDRDGRPLMVDGAP